MNDVIPIFSTPIYVSNDNYDLNENERVKIKEFSRVSMPNGNKNYSTSTAGNTYILNDFEIFSNLKKHIEKHIDNFITNVMLMPKQKLSITQSWLNYNVKDSGHHHHNHKNSVLSGIFYVKDTTKLPTIFTRGPYFFDNWQVEYSNRNIFNAEEFCLSMEPGKLVLFPSKLFHWVPNNETSATRITIAFNTFWKTNLGKEDTLTELRFDKIKNE